MNHDALIDRVARDMTAAEPRVDFRARVLARVTPRRRWPRVFIPASAIATAALCIWFLVPNTRTAVPGSNATIGAPVGSVAQASPAAGAADSPQIVVRAAHLRAARPVVSPEELAWRARAIPALPPVPPLAVDAIQPQPLSIAPITVHPIVSDPLSLAAIDPRAGGRE